MGFLSLFLARSQSGPQLHEQIVWFTLTPLHCYGLHSCRNNIPIAKKSKIKGKNKANNLGLMVYKRRTAPFLSQCLTCLWRDTPHTCALISFSDCTTTASVAFTLEQQQYFSTCLIVATVSSAAAAHSTTWEMSGGTETIRRNLNHISALIPSIKPGNFFSCPMSCFLLTHRQKELMAAMCRGEIQIVVMQEIQKYNLNHFQL